MIITYDQAIPCLFYSPLKLCVSQQTGTFLKRWASQVAQMLKNLPANAGDAGSIPGSGRYPQKREWQPTVVFLPGESHGQRNLEGYSPWGCKESDTAEWVTLTCFLRNLDAGREATVRTAHGATDWLQIGRGARQAAYRHPAYSTYMQSTSWETLGGGSTSWSQDCQEKHQ